MVDLRFRYKPFKLMHNFRTATTKGAGGRLVGNKKDRELKQHTSDSVRNFIEEGIPERD